MGYCCTCSHSTTHTHTHTHHSVGHLWTRDWPVAVTSTWKQITFARDGHLCLRRYSNPKSQQPRVPQTHTFDRAATRINNEGFHYAISLSFSISSLLFSYNLLTPFFATPQSMFHLLYEQSQIKTGQHAMQQVQFKLRVLNLYVLFQRPPLWSSGQSFWLQIQRSRVRFPALPDFSE